MTSAASHNIERIGVAAVTLAVHRALGWIVREQPTSDYGIDAHMEVVEDGPSGRLIGVQIKAGTAFFKEQTPTGIVYRGQKRHLDYWLRHSLPVIIVLHDVESDRSYWQRVTEDVIERTEKAWKLEVPFHQVLDANAREALQQIADASPYHKRLAALVFAKAWMDLLDDGNSLFLEAEEWVNKSSGRGSLRLHVRDEDGDEEVVADWPFVMFPLTPYEAIFPSLFPWAQITVDEDFYGAKEEGWNDECGAWDQENGEYMFHTESYAAWSSRRPSIRPYVVSGGEVARYRLELSLNALGRAFLITDAYLSTGNTSEAGESDDPDD